MDELRQVISIYLLTKKKKKKKTKKEALGQIIHICLFG